MKKKLEPCLHFATKQDVLIFTQLTDSKCMVMVSIRNDNFFNLLKRNNVTPTYLNSITLIELHDERGSGHRVLVVIDMVLIKKTRHFNPVSSQRQQRLLQVVRAHVQRDDVGARNWSCENSGLWVHAAALIDGALAEREVLLSAVQVGFVADRVEVDARREGDFQVGNHSVESAEVLLVPIA